MKVTKMIMKSLLRLEPLAAVWTADTHLLEILHDFVYNAIVVVGNEGLVLGRSIVEKTIGLFSCESASASGIFQLNSEAVVMHVVVV